jgi:hypothetical protein
MNGIMAPIPDPQETTDLQGRKVKGPRSSLFGGNDPLVCLFSRREKYCHNGGMPSPTSTVGRAAEGCQAEGPRSASWPLSWSLEAALLQGKRLGVCDSRPLGAAMDSSGCAPVCESDCFSESVRRSLQTVTDLG